ncbi:MAG: GNAT family N-acetyltransferase [Candidatus Limnocylindrales bacterium]
MSQLGRDWTFRRPGEDDHRRLSAIIDEWWGGLRMRQALPRLWLRHFSGTSWLMEDGDGRLTGFLIGFISPDDPGTACIHLAAADPNRRRQGVGRALYDRFARDMASRGVRRIEAITWPGNRVSVRFHAALGFQIEDGPGTRPIHGTPAFPDYDGDGEDRVMFSRTLEPRSPAR